MPPGNAIDDRLTDWAELATTQWDTLILGNGFSMNVWRRFGYDSLFGLANLPVESLSIFDKLETTNFEHVLECLYHAHLSAQSLRQSTEAIDSLYRQIRDALFQAVRAAHAPWPKLKPQRFERIATGLNSYRSVFTTNYDLLPYWSQMASSHLVDLDIRDLFWNPGGLFDPTNTVARSQQSTIILYLHGALHLWHDDKTGENGKWTRQDKNLLEFSKNYGPNRSKRPLFVSEGTSADKVRTIRQSSYLSHCLDFLRSDSNPTVVFGHAFTEQDDHVLEALTSGPRRQFAVSIYPAEGPENILVEKSRISRSLRGHDVVFFDSTTHPMGTPEIRLADAYQPSEATMHPVDQRAT